MYFQIKEIILWPRDSSFRPRRLQFSPGKVNVISGASRTGKSAVIPIIDYCLASKSCSIPVNTIRIACEWFGIVIVTADGEKMLARREPGNQRSTDDMFLLEAVTIEDIPNRITQKNINADDVRRMFDEFAGLTKLDFGGAFNITGGDRPSFRDLAAFNFQPQNIIANPDVLFFKTTTFDHKEKLKRIFPYILNAISPEMLGKQHELDRVQFELRKKERELKNAEDISARWNAELQSRISEAQELGLIDPKDSSAMTRETMISILEGLVSQPDVVPVVSAASISEAVRELANLEKEENLVSQELTTLRRRMVEMSRIRESSAAYENAMRIQRERLEVSTWLVHHHQGDVSCPFCGSDHEPSKKKLGEFQEALRDIESLAGSSADVPAAFDREFQRVQTSVETTSEQLRAVQVRKNALARRSAEVSQSQFRAQKAERFIGNLENALQFQRNLSHDEGLRNEVAILRAREKALLSELEVYDIDQRRNRAIAKVNAYAQKLLPHLDAERPEDPISLQIRDLTVRVTGPDREDYLSEIGSGSNWLSYHIATMLGLHQFFLSLKHSVVPSFLVIDQPSQVYFPKKSAIRDTDPEPAEEIPLEDEDVEAVHKIFALLGQVVEAANGQLQIIVLDHAPKSVWGDLPGVEALEEWRDGRKLVPVEWLS